MRKFSNKKLQNIILIALIIILVGVIFAIYIREKEEKTLQVMKTLKIYN